MVHPALLSLPGVARDPRHAQTADRLRSQLREACVDLMAMVLWMAPQEGPPDENLQGETVLAYIREGHYDHGDVVEALLRAVLYRLRNYHDMLLPWREHIRAALACHIEALHPPEHVARSVLQICQTPVQSLGEDTVTATDAPVLPALAISVFAAHMFLRYVQTGGSPSLLSYEPLRFQDNYFSSE